MLGRLRTELDASGSRKYTLERGMWHGEKQTLVTSKCHIPPLPAADAYVRIQRTSMHGQGLLEDHTSDLTLDMRILLLLRDLVNHKHYQPKACSDQLALHGYIGCPVAGGLLGRCLHQNSMSHSFWAKMSEFSSVSSSTAGRTSVMFSLDKQ